MFQEIIGLNIDELGDRVKVVEGDTSGVIINRIGMLKDSSEDARIQNWRYA